MIVNWGGLGCPGLQCKQSWPTFSRRIDSGKPRHLIWVASRQPLQVIGHPEYFPLESARKWWGSLKTWYFGKANVKTVENSTLSEVPGFESRSRQIFSPYNLRCLAPMQLHLWINSPLNNCKREMWCHCLTLWCHQGAFGAILIRLLFLQCLTFIW